MDVLEKAKRIKALIDYTEHNGNKMYLNYQLNKMFTDDPHALHLVKIEDIYKNEYRVYRFQGDPFMVEPEQWEKIVTDVYNQLYHHAYQKAQKKAIEKITIMEIEQNISSLMEK